jgi:hypothetical protein
VQLQHPQPLAVVRPLQADAAERAGQRRSGACTRAATSTGGSLGPPAPEHERVAAAGDRLDDVGAVAGS